MKKTVLITGTSGGFGADMVDTLHKAGHRVFAPMRDAKSTARETAEKFRAEGIEVLDLDVTSDASVDAAFEALFKKLAGSLTSLSTTLACSSPDCRKPSRPTKSAPCSKSTYSECIG